MPEFITESLQAFMYNRWASFLLSPNNFESVVENVKYKNKKTSSSSIFITRRLHTDTLTIYLMHSYSDWFPCTLESYMESSR